MNSKVYLIAFLDKPDLLEDMVERLAQRRYDIGYGKSKLPEPWKALESSTTENYISGTIEFAFNEQEMLRVPFASSFLFTCIKENREDYKLIWGSSLS
jgi:hypothetical protein